MRRRAQDNAVHARRQDRLGDQDQRDHDGRDRRDLVHQAHGRGIPVVLANGRISASSFPYYRCARPVLARVLRQYSLLMMQSGEDARRITAIGAPSEKMIVTGNIKFDKVLVEKTADSKGGSSLEAAFLKDCSGFPLIVAGSTHPGEEQILLDVLRRVRRIPELANARLLLAPRHPERFNEAAELVSHNGFSIRRRTDTAGGRGPADILLLDTLGELAEAYRFATVAFVGGTLIPRGGHSIMEPALYAKAIVTGPSMENFRGIVEEFRRQHGIRQISTGPEDRDLQVEELSQLFIELLQNAHTRDTLGKNALSILENNRGAAQLTADRIALIFEGSGKSREPNKQAV